MSVTAYFLWPIIRPCQVPLMGSGWATSDEVEKELGTLYPGSHCVLFTSARAGITAVLEVWGASREKEFLIPGFSNHCVIDALGRRVSVTLKASQPGGGLVFHQWGFPHKADIPLSHLIEDSADSLLVPGKMPFPNSGQVQVFSLPKIFGVSMGGFVATPDSELAEKIRLVRVKRSKDSILLRLLKRKALITQWGNALWTGWEPVGGGMPCGLVCRQILEALRKIMALVADRMEKLELLKEFIPSWANLSEGRLPSNLPLEFSEERLARLRGLGIITGVRHFDRQQRLPAQDYARVLPVPIHGGIPVEIIQSIRKIFLNHD